MVVGSQSILPHAESCLATSRGLALIVGMRTLDDHSKAISTQDDIWQVNPRTRNHIGLPPASWELTLDIQLGHFRMLTQDGLTGFLTLRITSGLAAGVCRSDVVVY